MRPGGSFIFLSALAALLVCAPRAAAGTCIVDSLDIAVTHADHVYVGTIRRAIPCGNRQAPQRHFLSLDVTRTLKGPAQDTLQCSVDAPPNVARLREWAERRSPILLCLDEARDVAGGIDEMMPPVIAVHGQPVMIPLDGTAEVLSADLTALRGGDEIVAWSQAAIDAAEREPAKNWDRTAAIPFDLPDPPAGVTRLLVLQRYVPNQLVSNGNVALNVPIDDRLPARVLRWTGPAKSAARRAAIALLADRQTPADTDALRQLLRDPFTQPESAARLTRLSYPVRIRAAEALRRLGIDPGRMIVFEPDDTARHVDWRQIASGVCALAALVLMLELLLRGRAIRRHATPASSTAFGIAATASLLVAVGSAALAAQGYYRTDAIDWCSATSCYQLASSRGGVQFERADRYTDLDRPRYLSFPAGTALDQRVDLSIFNAADELNVAGVRAARGKLRRPVWLLPSQGDLNYGYLRVPLWPVAVAASILPLVRLFGAMRIWRRRRRGMCPACGYDLRATGSRCPECGRRVFSAPARLASLKARSPAPPALAPARLGHWRLHRPTTRAPNFASPAAR